MPLWFTGGSAASSVALSNVTPLPNGTAAAGTAETASRSDHVHAYQGGGPRLPIGKYVALVGDDGAAFALTKDREYAFGVMLGPMTIDRIAFKLSNTPDGTPILRTGFRADADGTPGAATEVTSGIALTGGAGWKTGTISYTHPGGTLWIVWAGQGWSATAAQFEGCAGASAQPKVLVPLAAVAAGRSTIDFSDNNLLALGWQDSVTGALPGTFTNGTAGSPGGNPPGYPTIALRRSA